MPALTIAFVIAVAVETALRLWLATRQIHAVQSHRNDVPPMFRGQVAPLEQQRAADYTVARAALGRWATLFDGVFKLLLTVGGGIAVIDGLWRRSSLQEPWLGLLTVGSVFLVLQLADVPFALWRTF